MTLYAVLKVLHILAVVVWLGGGTAIAILTARLTRARDRAGLAALLPQMARFGPTVGGPASAGVLLTGIAMIFAGGIQMPVLWVNLGFAGILVHGVFGPFVMRKRAMAFGQAVGAQPSDDARIAATGARFYRASVLYLLLMMAVVAIMVLKPTG